jgi:hypothetical protein
MKYFVTIIVLLLCLKVQCQNLFHQDSVLNNSRTTTKIKKAILLKDRTYEIEKIVFANNEWAYSLTSKGQSKFAYSTKNNSYSVDQFTHWANVSDKTATQFYLNCGLTKYKTTDDFNGNNCIRLKNKSGTIFVQITKISSTKCMISISDIELSDETDV